MKEERFSFFAKPPDEVRQTQILTHFRDTYPFLHIGEIGRSILGRPLHFFRIGGGQDAVLYVGAHHGMEWITALLLYRLLDDLCRSAAERGREAVLPNGKSLYVLPLLNPDGVEIELHGAAAGGVMAERLLRQNNQNTDFIHWQANARGVDLNHNYDAGFYAYKEIERGAGILSGGPTRYSGEYPFSEPETEALRRFLKILTPALTLTLHTQGEEIFYHPVEPPVPRAAEIGSMLARLTGYQLGEADGMAAYGGMSDYVAEKLRLPAYTLECGLGCNPLPLRDAPRIYRRLRRALMLALALA